MIDFLFILMFIIAAAVTFSGAFMNESKKEIIRDTKKKVSITRQNLTVEAVLFIESYKKQNKLILDKSSLLCENEPFKFGDRNDKRFIISELKRAYWYKYPKIAKEYLCHVKS